MSFNFLRRSPLEKKLREHWESAPWRQRKIRLSGQEIRELRHYACMRSAGRCENSIGGERCKNWVTWLRGELAHMRVAHTRSDSRDQVLFVCRGCHDDDTKNRRKLVPHKEWIP